MDTLEAFISDIDAFLDRSGMTPTAFGRKAMGDPSFIPNLRSGRCPNMRTVSRIRTFITECDRAASASEAKDAA